MKTKNNRTIKKGYTIPKKEKDAVNLWRRFFAYLLDWLFGTFFAAFPVVILNGIVQNTTVVTDDLLTIPYPYSYIAGGLALLFSFIYFVLIPLKIWKGETVGKHLMHMKIVRTDGSDVGFGSLVLRNMFGMILIEGALFTTSTYLRQMAALVTGEVRVMQYLYYAGIGITIISILLVMFTNSNQAIHDLMGKTRVRMNTSK